MFAAFAAFAMFFHGHYKTSRPAPSSGSMSLQHVQQGPTAIANLKASQNRANLGKITTAQCSEHRVFKSLTHQGESSAKDVSNHTTWPHPRLGQSSTRSPDQKVKCIHKTIYIIHNTSQYTVPKIL